MGPRALQKCMLWNKNRSKNVIENENFNSRVRDIISIHQDTHSQRWGHGWSRGSGMLGMNVVFVVEGYSLVQHVSLIKFQDLAGLLLLNVGKRDMEGKIQDLDPRVQVHLGLVLKGWQWPVNWCCWMNKTVDWCCWRVRNSMKKTVDWWYWSWRSLSTTLSPTLSIVPGFLKLSSPPSLYWCWLLVDTRILCIYPCCPAPILSTRVGPCTPVGSSRYL